MSNHRSSTFVALVCLTLASACSDQDKSIIIGAGGSESTPDPGPEAQPPSGAVMLATMLRSPEGRLTYMGVFPELPTNGVDTTQMVELPDVNIYTFQGYIYAWEYESARFRRFSVSPDLSIVEGPSVSFQGLGATGFNETRFVSADRAYSLDFDSLQVVVWNPTLMELVGTIDASALESKGDRRPEFGGAVSFGDYVAWPILWSNYDALSFEPSQGVLFVHTGSDEPAFVVEDTRCGGGLSLSVDGAGDLYVIGNSYFGFGEFFATDPAELPPPCMLRIDAGTTAFDPGFYLDLSRAAESPAIYQTWRLDDEHLVAAVWDPADDPALLATPDDYWTAPLLRRLVVLGEQSSTGVVGIPKSSVWNAGEYRLDGKLLMTQYDIYDEAISAGDTTLYSIDAIGTATNVLTLPGELWAIGRVR